MTPEERAAEIGKTWRGFSTNDTTRCILEGLIEHAITAAVEAERERIAVQVRKELEDWHWTEWVYRETSDLIDAIIEPIRKGDP